MLSLEKSLAKEELVLLSYISAAVCVPCVAIFAALGWRLSRPCKITIPQLSPADRAIVQDPVKLDGLALHLTVPMHRWCVTREDLRQFERLVKSAVHDGRLVPTDMDPFNPADHAIGPCMHTVNSQFIKPVTQAAGGPSWALMKHPEGLDCDLFVTHGWAEGIYEFTNKVLNSWPSGAHSAYCCMLSNPQNLDISELCATPKQSPFAHALNHATFMLVVPNRTGSIYTRIWCAYEAFLAYSGDKQIRTAASVGNRFWLKTIQGEFAFIAGAAGTTALSACFKLAGWGGVETLQPLSASISFVLVLLYFRLRERLHGTKQLAGLRFGVLWYLGGYVATGCLSIPLYQPGTNVSFMVMALLPFYVAWAFQVDIVVAEQGFQETRQLQRGFTGKLEDAQCSVAADGERIRKELADSGSESALDEAVKVLIAMGTFTPRLCATVKRTGVLGHVDRFSMSMLAGVVSLWILVPLEHFTFNDCKKGWLCWLAWAWLVAWLPTFFSLPSDCKAFAVGGLLASVPTWGVGLMDMFLRTYRTNTCVREWGLACFSGPALLLLTLLGPARTAQLPLLGPPLVRLLTCSHRRPRRPRASRSEKDTANGEEELEEEANPELEEEAYPEL